MFRVGRWGGGSQWREAAAGWKEVVLGMGSGQRAGAPVCLGLSPCGWRYLSSREQGRRPGVPRCLDFTGRVGHGVCGLQERPAGNGVIQAGLDPGIQSDPGSSLGVGCGAWRWCWEGRGAGAAPGEALFLSVGVPGTPAGSAGSPLEGRLPARPQLKCRCARMALPGVPPCQEGWVEAGGIPPQRSGEGQVCRGWGRPWTARQKGPAWLSAPCPWCALADPGLCGVRRAARPAGGASRGHVAEVSARGVWRPQQGLPTPVCTGTQEARKHAPGRCSCC